MTEPTEELEHLLLWHVNRTLSSVEQARVEELLRQQPAQRRTFEFLRDVARVMRAEPRGYDESETLRNLLDRVHEGASNPAPQKRTPSKAAWVERLMALFEPKFAFAMLLIAVQGIFIGALITKPNEPSFSDVRALNSVPNSPASPTYRVNFVPTASEHDVRLLLVSAHARIVYGPTQLGDYYVRMAKASVDGESLLKQSKLVDAVEKVDRIPEHAE